MQDTWPLSACSSMQLCSKIKYLGLPTHDQTVIMHIMQDQAFPFPWNADETAGAWAILQQGRSEVAGPLADLSSPLGKVLLSHRPYDHRWAFSRYSDWYRLSATYLTLTWGCTTSFTSHMRLLIRMSISMIRFLPKEGWFLCVLMCMM